MRRNACRMVRECTRAMARRHAVKAEEVAHVVAGVVGSGQGERVGKMADVEAWRSPWRLTDTKQRPHARANREGTRAACPSRASAHPYLPDSNSNSQAKGEAPVFGTARVKRCRLLHSAGIW